MPRARGVRGRLRARRHAAGDRHRHRAPAAAPATLRYLDDAKAELQRGAIAVADSSFHVRVEPTKMDVNSEQRLSDLRWTGWGSERATGRADLRTLICEPNCAQGVYQDARAEIVLSAPKTCKGERFYTRASMTYRDPDTGKTRAPATYLSRPADAGPAAGDDV